MSTRNTSSKKDYQKLEEVFLTYYFLKRTLSSLHWDSEVMMPSGSEHIRSHQVEVQTSVMNELLLRPETEGLLQSVLADTKNLSEWQRANVREMSRMLLLKRALPPELEGQLASLRVVCQKAWRAARKENDYSHFEKAFAPLFLCLREKADLLSQSFSVTPYEALMQEFDPDSRELELSSLFNPLELPLIQFEIKISAFQMCQQQKIKPLPILSIKEQISLSRQVLTDLSFNFKLGRFDQSPHPFTEGGIGDIRITTHFKKNNVLSGLMGTVHECGHSMYDMNLPKNWYTQPVGQERGMSVHEGIALYFEMVVARSRGFSVYLSEQFKILGKSISSEDVYFHLTKVDPLSTRVDADEVSYLLHVSLRYDIETKLMSGDLTIKDIPDYWNQLTLKYFGYTPKDLATGCLQDIHWAVGLFGYFPSYAKGYIFALNLYQQFGGFTNFSEYPRILDNLKTHVFHNGSLLRNNELLHHKSFSREPSKMVMSYLNQKYSFL